MRGRDWLVLLVVILLLRACGGSARADDPIPTCGPDAQAGRVELEQGDPAPVWCACYDDTAETCLLATVARLRGDLALASTEAGARLKSCEAARGELAQAISEAADEVDQARADLLAAAPPWWDRAWVGSAATLVVVGVVVLVAR